MSLLNVVLLICLAAMAVELVLCAYRALTGPTVADRVVAVDSVGPVLIGMVVLGSMYLRENKYLDYVLVLAVLSFMGTVVWAKYLERGVVIERDSD